MYHDYCIIGACISFFVPTSDRPLPVTTFFVFLKPLCSHFAAQIVIQEFSALLQKRCLSLSKGSPLLPKFVTAAAQRFYSSFVVLLEAILQRCSSAARFVQVMLRTTVLNIVHLPIQGPYSESKSNSFNTKRAFSRFSSWSLVSFWSKEKINGCWMFGNWTQSKNWPRLVIAQTQTIVSIWLPNTLSL